MRCSECSKPIKPVVAIDIDGTLGDYHGHFISFASTYLGRAIKETYVGNESMREWWMRETGTSEELWRQVKLAYRQGGQKRSMPAYPGATSLCSAVRSAGAELFITTTRPYLRLDGIDPDTRFWLSQHGIKYDGLLYDEHKYSVLAKNIDQGRVVAVLDDLPEQCKVADVVFGLDVPLMRMTKYNERAKVPREVRVVWKLGEARELIERRIYRWREQHD